MTRPDLDELRRKISAYQQTAGSAFGEATAEEIIMCVPALLRDAEAGRKLRDAVADNMTDASQAWAEPAVAEFDAATKGAE